MDYFKCNIIFGYLLGMFYYSDENNQKRFKKMLKYILPLPLLLYYSYNLFYVFLTFDNEQYVLSTDTGSKIDFLILVMCLIIKYIKIFHTTCNSKELREILLRIFQIRKINQKDNCKIFFGTFVFLMVHVALIRTYWHFIENFGSLQFYLSYQLTILYNLFEQLITYSMLSVVFEHQEDLNKNLQLLATEVITKVEGVGKNFHEENLGKFTKSYNSIVCFSLEINKILGVQQLLSLAILFCYLISYVYYIFILVKNMKESYVTNLMFCIYWIFCNFLTAVFLLRGWCLITREVSSNCAFFANINRLKVCLREKI